MFRQRRALLMAFTALWLLIAPACDRMSMAEEDRVCVVLDTGLENDRGFNQYTLQGARTAARELGLQFAHVSSTSADDYGPNIERFVQEGCDMIITVGFLMGDATAEAARANPDIHFAIVDVAYFPGAGCAEDVASCYTSAGGMENVTSLMFAEDEVGYLAGTLASCVSETGIIGAVAGMQIPPVERFVTGYRTGARDYDPFAEILHVYIPSFDDPTAGWMAAEVQMDKGADVIFGVGGNTGNGGLVAAHDAGRMGIGVDVDQYHTLPDINQSLLTSAMKNVDVAANTAVRAFAADELEAGIRLSTVASGGIGLAPYHEMDSAIPDECKSAVAQAERALIAGEVDTGYEQ